MTLEAYPKTYVKDLSHRIGLMLEKSHKHDLDVYDIWNTFIHSNIAKEIEKGNAHYLSGFTSMEYLRELTHDNALVNQMIRNNDHVDFDQYYWSGSTLIKLQHRYDISFVELDKKLPLKKILEMYSPFHEMDINRFYEDMDEYFSSIKEETNLKKYRTNMGLSQSQLAELSNVDIRSIQMYEQRHNDINKAQGITLYKLAKALKVDVQDLLEK